MKKAALISVSDRTALPGFAAKLQQLGYLLLCTSGSLAFLKEQGLEAQSIEQYTGQPEILDGRVKTLHPKIHAGLLARRDKPEHMRELEEHGIYPIELAVINLYPFLKNLESEAASDPQRMVELIDVGGPAMIRAAAKNGGSVYVVTDPADYPKVAEALEQRDSEAQLRLRRALAVKAFTLMAADNLAVAKYFSAKLEEHEDFPPVSGEVLVRADTLRYGENPHQAAALYREFNAGPSPWSQLSGKELSYNNLLDLDAVYRVISSFQQSKPFCAIIKHLNPCGAALAETVLGALEAAKLGDPRSHFGGIIGFNRPVDRAVAENIREDFAELVVAPDFSAEALDLLRKNKNLRIIKVMLSESGHSMELRSVAGGTLCQAGDQRISSVEEAQLVTSRGASPAELSDLQFAWNICAHVKSNAIVIVREHMVIGVGAGQMSRIDSVELAISKAQTHGHQIRGGVAASDAFFPFPDSIERLAAAGVRVVIATSGSKRDAESIRVAEQLGISLYFSADRHFRH